MRVFRTSRFNDGGGSYKRPLKARVGDAFYNLRLRVFGTRTVSKTKSGRKRTERLFIISMLAIPALNWLVFWLYVNISSFALAFQNNFGEWSLINFRLLWGQLTSPYGATIGLALKNTCYYFLNNLFIIFPLSVFISYFIFKRILGYKVFRVIFFLPAIISGVAMTSVYTAIISPNGPLGALCRALNIPFTEGLLNSPKTATKTILVYCVWTGFCSNIILIGGAMSRVPVEVLESAKIEGCGPFRELVQIVLPLVWSTLSTMLVFILTGIFNASGPILLFMPDGGSETTTLSFWIFKQVYGNGEMGGTGNYGLVSCAGLCFTAIGVPLILTIRWLFEKIPAVEY